MKRKGFFINSAVIVLIIPLLLLLATYEDVSSFIVQSQSVRTQSERTYNVVNSVTLDFQKALEISGKRALVAAVDYVVNTGNFLNNTNADQAIKELILQGQLSGLNYDFDRVMKDQSIKTWVSNISDILKSQGFKIVESPDEVLDNVDVTVAPLDAFTVVIKGRITNITIAEESGNVVYQGPIPSSGGYVYAFVDLNGLEDPLHSGISNGKYFRSIQACKYPYPKLTPPFAVANGTGSGNGVVVGDFGKELGYNLTHIWDSSDNGTYITNLTINGEDVKTDAVIINVDDIGVMVFGNGGSETSEVWCYPPFTYRVDFTLSGGDLDNYDGYQIPIVITDTRILSKIYYDGSNAAIRIVEKGTCREVPFWIEYWSSTKAIIWIKATASMEYTIYFGDDPSYATRGDGAAVFEWFHDVEETISDGDYKVFDLSSLNLVGSIAIRFRAKPSRNRQWDSGIVVGTSDSNNNPQWVYFIDDTKDNQNSLEVFDAYYVWARGSWELRSGTPTHTNDGLRGDTKFHTYEVVMEPDINGAYVDFLDYGNSYSLYPNPVRENPDGPLRHYTAPLRYLYLFNFGNGGNRNNAIFEWIFIWRYIRDLPDETFSAVEQKATQTTASSNEGSVYDIQPLIDCLLGNRYFGIEGGWSFFERLEGNTHNHDRYVQLAHKMQDELNYKPENGYYPIGLVSFMIPHVVYDERLFNVMSSNGIPIEEGQSSADYYFLEYYFGSGSKVSGNRVWGISRGTFGVTNLGIIPFFLDKTTACELLGWQGALQLVGYSCP